MNKSIIHSIRLLILAFLVPTMGGAGELEERVAVQQSVFAAVRNRDFKLLDAMSVDYRTTQSRSASGLWKLTLFNSGLSYLFDTRRREDSFWVASQKVAEEWVRSHPQSPAAHLAYAQMLLNRGWSYRGNGRVNTVKPEDWPSFFEYTQRARQYLEENKQIAHQDPRWYEMMAIIAYRQGWTPADFEQLIDEGLSLYPSFYQIYFAAIDFYSPKWGGNTAFIEKFARDAQKRTSQFEGNGMYARIYWYASQTQYGDDLFSASLVHWGLMKKGIDDVLAKYPDGWNINNFARFACLAGDKAKTAELMRRADFSPLPAAWGGMETYQQCREWSRVG